MEIKPALWKAQLREMKKDIMSGRKICKTYGWQNWYPVYGKLLKIKQQGTWWENGKETWEIQVKTT